MSGFLSAIELLKRLVDLIAWAITEGRKKLEELAAKRRVEAVAAAIEKAKKAKTVEEKRKAACAIEKTFNPDSDCDAAPRS